MFYSAEWKKNPIFTEQNTLYLKSICIVICKVFFIVCFLSIVCLRPSISDRIKQWERWHPGSFPGLERKLEIQHVLWASSLAILLSQGRFLLDVVNDFVRGWLAWTLAHLASKLKLLAQQENLLVPVYGTGMFSSLVFRQKRCIK